MDDPLVKEIPDKTEVKEDPPTCPDCEGVIVVRRGDVFTCLACGREWKK